MESSFARSARLWKRVNTNIVAMWLSMILAQDFAYNQVDLLVSLIYFNFRSFSPANIRQISNCFTITWFPHRARSRDEAVDVRNTI